MIEQCWNSVVEQPDKTGWGNVEDSPQYDLALSKNTTSCTQGHASNRAFFFFFFSKKRKPTLSSIVSFSFRMLLDGGIR